MLGGLARWLRMPLYVTAYITKSVVNCLIQGSQVPDSVLLTRDEELHNPALGKNIHSVLVIGGTEEARLGQLARTLGVILDIDMSATRCPECGAELHEITKQEAASDVPAKSLELYDRFWRCNNAGCGKTYWVGSHWKQIRHTLEEARKIMSSLEKDTKC